MNTNIKNAAIPAPLNYDDNFTKMMSQASAQCLDEYNIVQSSHNSRYFDYSNLDGPTSGRPGLRRRDWDYFRPDDELPTKHHAIMAESDEAYHEIGIVKNVIDLMGDFATQGIRIVHPVKSVQNFYKSWWDKVDATDRSERFVNYLCRHANVFLYKQTAKITPTLVKKMRAKASPDIKLKPNKKLEKREIPWRYTFLNPRFIISVGANLSSFTDAPIYAINLPWSMRQTIKNPKTEEEKEIVRQLPANIKRAAQESKPVILDPQKSCAYFYKKDDWASFAKPMLFSLLDDARQLRKLKLADRAALDGATSTLRIIKLGSLEHKIPPSPKQAAKLVTLLEANVGGGVKEIVWGADIDVWESSTDVHQFLGEEKYRPTWHHIYSTLGVPPSITGMFGNSGTTNNYISLKTLTKRLEYTRGVLLSFWMSEIKLVHEAMSFTSELPTIEFDTMSLSDEEAQLQLLMHMADRNIVSDESIQYALKKNPDLERKRLTREERERGSKRRPHKAGPYHDPQEDFAYKKIALQNGAITPGEVGLELEERRPGEKTALEIQEEQNKMREQTRPSQDKRGDSTPGRPKNSNDKKKRATKTFKPRNKATIQVWAQAMQDKIAKTLKPALLSIFNKKNMRSLNADETASAEQIKFGVLSHLEPFDEVDAPLIFSCAQKQVKEELGELFEAAVQDFEDVYERLPSLEEARILQTNIYADYYNDEN